MTPFNLVLIISNLFFLNAYGIFTIQDKQMTEKYFMTMSNTCFIGPGQKYGCDYISTIFWTDPYFVKDIETVCRDSNYTVGYDIDNFKNLINMRLSHLGISTCQLSVTAGFEKNQLKTQCPTEYKRHCEHHPIPLLLDSDNNTFMQTNSDCLSESNNRYGCKDIPYIIAIDPNKDFDTENICASAKKSAFNIDQFTEFVNTQLTKYGLNKCRVNVINYYNKTQLKNLCPVDYKYLCSTTNKILKILKYSVRDIK